METNNKNGCQLCDATWGEYWREIEGQNMYFCCNLCADAFENIVNEVKRRTGWSTIEYLELHGNYIKGRECVARNMGQIFRFYVRTYSDGRLMEFIER
ncbi:hypothetical protein GCM10007108_03920 [Thermogymnomonas acidicola]|uniref:Uncharacterized protein n=1 Tax=Thermogymnomonas acidicola TaxID=399579 RepID=A0AA37BQA1_9ARCH|nr:TA0938 family protein [Thermogymnomonas acidicola]GGM68993.1 hypothetical protein GCM10007108_03920 [Thermogymnomonas acidicola]